VRSPSCWSAIHSRAHSAPSPALRTRWRTWPRNAASCQRTPCHGTGALGAASGCLNDEHHTGAHSWDLRHPLRRLRVERSPAGPPLSRPPGGRGRASHAPGGSRATGPVRAPGAWAARHAHGAPRARGRGGAPHRAARATRGPLARRAARRALSGQRARGPDRRGDRGPARDALRVRLPLQLFWIACLLRVAWAAGVPAPR
jgi:hypothetical protein